MLNAANFEASPLCCFTQTIQARSHLRKIPPRLLNGSPPVLFCASGCAPPVDDRTSFTGDPVEGVLLDPVLVPGTDTVLPKNAVLDGVITRLEHHYQPWNHYLVDIQFEHLTYAKHSFRRESFAANSKEKLSGARKCLWLSAARLGF